LAGTLSSWKGETMRKTILLSSILAVHVVHACSCFGPDTFCSTLAPPYPQPEWWLPDAVVMAVVVGEEAYGVDVRIVRSYFGEVQHEEVIRVWGDCGALCRQYVTGWVAGDTVLWAIQHSDLSGNVICGTELEAPSDYQLSVCGVYSLDYANGAVSGRITKPTQEEMSIDAFEQLVNDCLSTGIEEAQGQELLQVSQGSGGAVLSLSEPMVVDLAIIDAAGRMCAARVWDGSPYRMDRLPSGVYNVTVRTKEIRLVRKVLVP